MWKSETGLLIMFAKRGWVDQLEALLMKGADVHYDNNHALRSAAYFGRYDAVKILLKYGAHVWANDNEALTSCIKKAVGNPQRFFAIVTLLLEHGATITTAALTYLEKNFCENLADALLPYCKEAEYSFFPTCYIKAKIIPTKNANNT